MFGAFSFDTKGPKEKAWRKENAVYVGSAHTRKLLKKFDQNLKSALRADFFHSSFLFQMFSGRTQNPPFFFKRGFFAFFCITF